MPRRTEPRSFRQIQSDLKRSYGPRDLVRKSDVNNGSNIGLNQVKLKERDDGQIVIGMTPDIDYLSELSDPNVAASNIEFAENNANTGKGRVLRKCPRFLISPRIRTILSPA